MSMNAYKITPSGITAIVMGAMLTVPTDHPNYARIVAALKDEDYAKAQKLMDLRHSVREFLKADKSFKLDANDRITLDGSPLPSIVSDKVLKMIDAGNEPDPIFNCIRRFNENVSKTATDEGFLFVAANDFLIDERGYILAYKAVDDNFMDLHSRSVCYKPAHLMTPAERKTFAKGVVGGREKNVTTQVVNGVTVITMPRNKVDDKRDNTCSNGLHFAAFKYAKDFGGNRGHLLIIALNPADVVSIPSDYHNEKGRACRFEVVGVISDKAPMPVKPVLTKSDLRSVSTISIAPSRPVPKSVKKPVGLTRAEASKEVAKKVSIRRNVDTKFATVSSEARRLRDRKKGWRHLQPELERLAGQSDTLTNEISELRQKYGV